MWVLQNFFNRLFYRTPPVAASGLFTHQTMCVFKIPVFILNKHMDQMESFSNSSSASTKSGDEVKIIVDIEFHFLFSFVKLKSKTDQGQTYCLQYVSSMRSDRNNLKTFSYKKIQALDFLKIWNIWLFKIYYINLLTTHRIRTWVPQIGNRLGTSWMGFPLLENRSSTNNEGRLKKLYIHP